MFCDKSSQSCASPQHRARPGSTSSAPVPCEADRRPVHTDILYDRLEHDRQVVLRGTSFVDGINVFNSSFTTAYRVEVLGWILPS